MTIKKEPGMTNKKRSGKGVLAVLSFVLDLLKDTIYHI